jgi:hypothetical protein
MNWQLASLSYFCAFLFWLEVSLGLMGILMVGRLTGGKWFQQTESILKTSLPLVEIMAVFYIPIFFALSQIYSWDRLVPQDPHQIKYQFFLNPFWFRVRAFVYWVLWLSLARLLRSRHGHSPLLNGLGLVVLLFTVSFSGQDWIMSLDPSWTSTGFGVCFFASCMVAAFSFLFSQAILRKNAALPLRDFGNLLLMSTLFWAYVNFLQYLIIWSGQIPREMDWYRTRSVGIYADALIFIALVGFALPAFALLFRKLKESPEMLLTIAVTLGLARAVELFWLIFPVENFAAVFSLFGSALLLIGLGFCFSKRFSNDSI